jgi:hypothetical protein
MNHSQLYLEHLLTGPRPTLLAARMKARGKVAVRKRGQQATVDYSSSFRTAQRQQIRIKKKTKKCKTQNKKNATFASLASLASLAFVLIFLLISYEEKEQG